MDAGTRFMELHRSGTFGLVNVADAGSADRIRLLLADGAF